MFLSNCESNGPNNRCPLEDYEAISPITKIPFDIVDNHIIHFIIICATISWFMRGLHRNMLLLNHKSVFFFFSFVSCNERTFILDTIDTMLTRPFSLHCNRVVNINYSNQVHFIDILNGIRMRFWITNNEWKCIRPVQSSCDGFRW